jgi:adenylate kinase family enzyme
VTQGARAVVELVGLAGSGKSTLARELVASDPRIELGLPMSRAASAAAQVAAGAPFVLPYLRECRGTAWLDRAEARGLGYLLAWRKSLNRPTTKRSPVLFDHGPLFHLARLDALGPPLTSTVSFRRWWERTLDDYAELLDVVVWLEAPDDLLLRRILSRNQPHALREADDDAARRFFAAYRASYRAVLTRVEHRRPGAVLEMRSDRETPSELGERVRRRLFAQGRSPE